MLSDDREALQQDVIWHADHFNISNVQKVNLMHKTLFSLAVII